MRIRLQQRGRFLDSDLNFVDRPGGAARVGIPLGSTEIGNLGVSSFAAVPTPSVSPIIGSQSLVAPAMPVVTAPVAASSTTAAGVLP